ncbi:MAG: stage II sporulation protein R [Bacilli bacterium]|nr:stage II sporulation protein R [Bacilli bacterium]
MKKYLFVLVLFIIFLVLYINVNAEIIIPSDAIRVRVVPNSNSVVDQNMKDKVKNYVSNYMMIKLDGINDVNEARNIINNSIDELNSDIKNMFKINNYNMDFKVIYGENYFPNKVYKGVIYDAGEYESLVVYIGKSKGDNWWCVLFPPLCLLEASESETGEVQYRSLVKDILDKIF